MRRIAILTSLALVGAMLLTGCGRGKDKDTTDLSVITSSAMESMLMNGGEAGELWIQNYDWGTAKETQNTPLLGASTEMPADAENLLSTYPVAMVIADAGKSEIVRPASDVLKMDVAVNAYGAIYLFTEDDPLNSFVPSEADLEMIVPIGTNMTLKELLESGTWCVQNNAITIEELMPENYDYGYDQTAELLDVFIKEYGVPNGVTNIAYEKGVCFYLLLWDVDNAAYGLYIKDAHFVLDGEDNQTLTIAGRDYYAPAYLDAMKDVQDEFYDRVDLETFIAKLNSGVYGVATQS